MHILRHYQPFFEHFTFAIVVTLLTVLLSTIMWDWIDSSPFILFFGAVAISAWYGGLGAGMVSGVLCIGLADYFLIEPRYVILTTSSDAIHLIMFSLVAFLISWTENHRIRSEYLLRQAHDQLHVILNGISEGVTAQNREGKVVFANETAARLLGYSSADALINLKATIIQRKFTLYTIDNEPLAFDKLPRFEVFRAGKSVAITFQLRFADDSTQRWIELKTSPVLDKQGHVILVVNIFRDVTETIELEQERTQYQAIVHHSEDAIISKRLDGTVSSWNTGAERIYGYSAEEMIGKHISLIFPSEIKAQELQLTERIRQGEKIVNYDTERIGKGGRRIHISKTISPIRDHRGEIVGYASIERDITQRVVLDKQQREAEVYLRKVLDTLPIMVGVMTPDGRLVEANRSALQAANLDITQVINQPFPDTYWWSYSSEIQNQLWDTINRAREGETVRYDVPVRIDNNQYMTIDFILSPMFDEDGKLIYLIPAALDISERIQREGEILRLTLQAQKQRKRLRDIIANVPGIVYEGSGDLDAGEQRMDFISDYAETMLGYALEDWKSVPNFWKQVVHPDDWDWAVEQANHIYESRRPGSVQFRCISKAGETIFVEAYSAIIEDEHGKRYGTCGVVMDITDRKQMEDALIQHTEQLKRSNEELEQFAYVASHDLQEPLRMVTSYLQLIEKRYSELLDESGREFMQFAVDGASRMKSLIADLLTYSRVQRSTIKYESVDMKMVVQRANHNLQVSIEETNAVIEVGDLPTVMGHEEQLVQLLQNLIGNGIKFQQTGRRPVIQIACKNRRNDWVFSISDNGIGIDPQYVDRIFIIFQRLHARDEYAGTGIGLAISKKIVEKHGGEIWLKSIPDEGTTFYFSIPKKRSGKQA